MLFNSFIFLLVFIPALIILLSISNIRKDYLLICFSFSFYAYSGLSNFLLLISEVIWIFACTRVGFLKKNLFLSISVLVLILIFYKYYNHLFMTFSDSDLLNKIIMPVGISFFTFQMISYLVDIRKNKKATLNLKELFCYITFFPQLVAGPIVRVSRIIKPLKGINKFILSYNKLKNALALFLIGLSIKVLLADNLAKLSYFSYDTFISTSFFELSFIMLSYSLQIYLDFFGYTICALGLGRLFGLRLPQNFKSPYKSKNPVEFWRRWHITLSFWLRDYVYIPLGGNKSYIRNIFIVFLICGVWHGSEIGFVIWGIYHFSIIIIYKKTSLYWDKLNSKLQIIFNFLFVSFGWVFFKFSLEELSNMSIVFDFSSPNFDFLYFKYIILSIFICITFFISLEKIYYKLSSLKSRYFLPLIYGFIIFINLVFIVDGERFIYFIF